MATSIMRGSLWRLVLVLASLFLGLHALKMQPEVISLRPRVLQTRQSLATCGYSAIQDDLKNENTYVLSIRLPGIWWKTLCHEQLIMRRVTEPIERRCKKTWTEKGVKRQYDGELHARVEDGECLVKIEVTLDRAEDDGFPLFDDDCILEPRPQLCGLTPESIPWPSECYRTEQSTAPPDAPPAVAAPAPEQAPAAQGKSSPPTESKTSRTNRPYTEAENALLLRLRGEDKSWKEIENSFENRTWQGLRRQWGVLTQDPDAPKNPQYKFSQGEDELLLEMVEKGFEWPEIATFFTGRSLFTLQQRYKTLTEPKAPREAPTYNRNPAYTTEDDALMIRAKEVEGLTWKQVAEKYFPNRTQKGLEIRYSSLKRRARGHNRKKPGEAD